MPDIIDTNDMAEAVDFNEDEAPREDMGASTEEKPDGISFHVQMRSWTLNDMTALIVEAAATQLVGRVGKNEFAKLVEKRALEILEKRADAVLSKVATDVLATQLTPTGFSQKAPITIGESLGMLGREYLEQKVNHDGTPAERGGYAYGEKQTRMQWILAQTFTTKFGNELTKASADGVKEVQAAIKAHQQAVIESETAKFREALQKVAGA